MTNIEYKRAGDGDVELLVHQRILFACELGGILPATIEATIRSQNRAYFEREINKSYISWYALAGEEVVSIAGLHIRSLPGNQRNPSGMWGYILNVYTAPEYRRKGLSKAVLKLLMATASEEYGVTAFELHATEAGRQLYECSGFSVHPEPTYRKYVLR